MRLPVLFCLCCTLISLPAVARPRVHAHFERVSILHGALPRCAAAGSPWSPSGRWLLVQDGSALRRFDATRPQDSLKTLLTLGLVLNFKVSWSPDSKWIACGFNELNGSTTLWAIPVEGGQPVGFERVEDVRRFVWASDGSIYGWSGMATQPIRFTLPNKDPSSTAHGVAVPRLLNLDPYAVRFTPDVPSEVFPFPDWGIYPPIRATFPDGRRFVVGASVVNSEGESLGNLDGPAREDSSGTELNNFTPSSVTSDSRFVAGYYDVTESGPGDDEFRILKSPVFLTDTLGRARVPLQGAPYSRRIECAPRGPWMALEAAPGLVVGRLSITP